MKRLFLFLALGLFFSSLVSSASIILTTDINESLYIYESMDTVLQPNAFSESGTGPRSQATGFTYEMETDDCVFGNCSIWEYNVDEWWGYSSTASGDGINFTWALWFNSNGSTGTNQYLISEYISAFARDYYAYINSGGDLILYWWDTTDTGHSETLGTVEWGEWHHLAFAFSDDTAYGYFDGEQIFATPIGGAGLQNDITAGSGDYIFMLRNNQPTTKLDGYADDLALWNRVVTEEEIALIYYESLSGTCANLTTQDYTITDGVLYANASSPFLYSQLVSLDYDYSGVESTDASGVISDTTESIAGVTTWFPIIIVITAMVVLILLTVLIVRAVRGSGLMSGGSA